MIPSLSNANDRLVEIVRKRIPLGYCFNRGDRFPASEQKVVSLARFQQGFADGDSRSSGEIGLRPILNNPTGLLEEEINLLPSPFVLGSWLGANSRSTHEKIALCRWKPEIYDALASGTRSRVTAYTGNTRLKEYSSRFITTSDFSRDAVDYVSKIGSKIVLIDGSRLAELMIEFGVAVATDATYTVKRIDNDFFEAIQSFRPTGSMKWGFELGHIFKVRAG